MDIGAKEIILVMLGFFLSFVPQWFDRRRKIKTHWAALRAEANLCNEKAIEYMKVGVMAPLYRLPTIAFEKSFPVLLIEGELSEEESLSINRYFAQAQDINRGLDNATAMAHADQPKKLEVEYQRNFIKATELTIGTDEDGGLSKPAFEIIKAKLGRSWWQR